MIEWKHYNVHWHMTGDTNQKGKTSITALDKEDAKRAFEARCRNEAADQRHYPFEAKVDKVIGPLGIYEATPKQKLAQRYAFILGTIKGAETMMRQCHEHLLNEKLVKDNPHAMKIMRAEDLAHAQFAKLQRDIRDLFKLAGLKVK